MAVQDASVRLFTEKNPTNRRAPKRLSKLEKAKSIIHVCTCGSASLLARSNSPISIDQQRRIRKLHFLKTDMIRADDRDEHPSLKLISDLGRNTRIKPHSLRF